MGNIYYENRPVGKKNEKSIYSNSKLEISTYIIYIGCFSLLVEILAFARMTTWGRQQRSRVSRHDECESTVMADSDPPSHHVRGFRLSPE